MSARRVTSPMDRRALPKVDLDQYRTVLQYLREDGYQCHAVDALATKARCPRTLVTKIMRDAITEDVRPLRMSPESVRARHASLMERAARIAIALVVERRASTNQRAALLEFALRATRETRALLLPLGDPEATEQTDEE